MPDSPKQAGDFWVFPSIDDPAGGSLRVSVAIAVGDPKDLQDTDIQVDVVANGQSLTQSEGPPSGTLPVVQLNGLNAYAQFRFDNPGDLQPSRIQVTVRGGTTAFDLPTGNV